MCGKAPKDETPKDCVEWKDVCKRCILPGIIINTVIMLFVLKIIIN